MTLSPRYPRSRNSGLIKGGLVLAPHNTDKLISGPTANMYIDWAPAAALIVYMQYTCSTALTNNKLKHHKLPSNHDKCIASVDIISSYRPPLDLYIAISKFS